MPENALLIELDELDVESIELPQDEVMDSLTTGYATTEIGASCARCNCGHCRTSRLV